MDQQNNNFGYGQNPAPQPQQPQYQPQYGQPQYGQPQYGQQPQYKPQNPLAGISAKLPKNLNDAKKYKKPAIIVAAAIVFIIIIAIIANANSPKSLAKKYVKASLNGDIKKADSYELFGGKDYMEFRAEEDDKDLDEYLEDNYDCEDMNEYYEEMSDNRKDYMDDKYGDYKVKIKEVKKCKKYTNSKLKKLKKRYDDDDFIDSDKISAAWTVKIKYRIEGDEKNDTDTAELTIVKYKGKLKVLG